MRYLLLSLCLIAFTAEAKVDDRWTKKGDQKVHDLRLEGFGDKLHAELNRLRTEIEADKRKIEDIAHEYDLKKNLLRSGDEIGETVLRLKYSAMARAVYERFSINRDALMAIEVFFDLPPTLFFRRLPAAKP